MALRSATPFWKLQKFIVLLGLIHFESQIVYGALVSFLFYFFRMKPKFRCAISFVGEHTNISILQCHRCVLSFHSFVFFLFSKEQKNRNVLSASKKEHKKLRLKLCKVFLAWFCYTNSKRHVFPLMPVLCVSFFRLSFEICGWPPASQPFLPAFLLSM